MKIKKYLNGNEFILELKEFFKKIPDKRSFFEIPLEDALLSSFAIFQLKYPSLLQFESEQGRRKRNLQNIFKIDKIPSDTRMREILDDIPNEELRHSFKLFFNRLQEGKILEKFKYIHDYVLISSDGTGVFSSKKVFCEQCLEKYHQNSKEVSYHHQILTAAIVHPDQKAVIPLAPEQIIREDGHSKNDCELNASKRMWLKFREDHPKLKVIALEDALSANAPHVQFLKRLQLSFIITAKDQGNAALFKAVSNRQNIFNDVQTVIENKIAGEKIKKEVRTIYRFVNEIPLNSKTDSPSVNFFDFEEQTTWINGKGEKKEEFVRFAWITDIELNEMNIKEMVAAGRCRWKIENETFNTLKNLGYNFEHNYGHGHKNLCSNFSTMMLLAFCFDQTLELCCDLYQELRALTRTKYSLWEAMRANYRYFEMNDWNHFLETILLKEKNSS